MIGIWGKKERHAWVRRVENVKLGGSGIGEILPVKQRGAVTWDANNGDVTLTST